MKATEKIFQVQGNKNAHYVLATSSRKAINAAKKIYPLESIDFASDFTDKFTEEERNNLPEWVLKASEIL